MIRRALLVAGLLALCSVLASAGPVVLTFEGLQNSEPVDNFYNGGTGGFGSGPGPSLGISFTDNSQAFIQDEDGGSLNAAGLPSPDTGLVFLSGAAATMNVPAGFTTGFSFFYSAINVPGVINVWSGLDDGGTLLATLTLPVTPSEVGSNPACTDGIEPFCPLVPIGVSFSGTAMSVDFGGTENQIVFDDITLGSATAGGGTPSVPEPSTFAMLGLGVALTGLRAIRRKQAR